MPDTRQEELWCHGCSHYVQFSLDYDLDGRHVLNCPNCGHEHYRIIRRGRITSERWGSNVISGISTYTITNCTASTMSLDDATANWTASHWTTDGGTTAGTAASNLWTTTNT